jgi:hypothetical protein
MNYKQCASPVIRISHCLEYVSLEKGQKLTTCAKNIFGIAVFPKIPIGNSVNHQSRYKFTMGERGSPNVMALLAHFDAFGTYCRMVSGEMQWARAFVRPRSSVV